MKSNGPRRRLTRQQREAKLKEWKRRARRLGRGKIKIPWHQIPDQDAETIAFERGIFPRAAEILNARGVKFGISALSTASAGDWNITSRGEM